MQRPSLRKPVCEIEEIVDDASNTSAAQAHPSHPSPDEANASGSGSQLRSAEPAKSYQLPAAALSDDEDEFHDVLEPVHPLEAHPEAAPSSAHEADDAESFHDAVEPALSSSTPKPESLKHREGSPGVFQGPPIAAPQDLPASPMDCTPITIPPETAPEGSAPSAAVGAGHGKLPSPEPYRRVRSPQSGSRPYPTHSPGSSAGAQTAAGVGVPGGDRDGEEPVCQEGREEGNLGSLPAAGAPELREYSAEEMQASVEKAEELKKDGNALYAAGDMEGALEKYGEALGAALDGAPQRAMYFANRAACQLKLKEWGPAASDCTRALEIDPGYLKALARRCAAYQELDDLDRALSDAQKVLELDPEDAAMKKIVKKLEPIVEERREKMKDEMMGKLKDLGNTVLGKFGLSLDNFKAEKDPSTGSYSIQFNQS